MNRVLKFSLWLAVFACLPLAGSAQTPAQSKEKIIKWTAINGENNEFAVFLPEGYVTAGDSNYRLGASGGAGAQVDKHIVLARYINGAVLLMDYYEGGAKQIQKTLLEREKLTIDKQEEINGFQMKSFSGKPENRFHKVQHFLIKNRLYVVKAISIAENEQIVKAFFESIRLVTQGKAVAPNAPAGATTTNLPQLIERETERLDDSKTFSMKEVDRRPIILKSSRPRFTFEMRRGMSGGKLRLKVLFSSSGQVTKVEVLESPLKLLDEAAIQTVKETIFIPAEKDGKLVSVYQIIEHSFEMGRS